VSERALRRWTVEEFFAWQKRQEERYELVDGFPVQMMVGVRNVHNVIVVNVVASLHSQLRGKDCRPFTGESSIESFSGQIRRPDTGVDCGKPDPNAYKAALPRLVVEVLSPSTRYLDLVVKLEEYKQVGSLLYLLYIDPDQTDAILWSRPEGGEWRQQRSISLDEVLAMPAIGIRLAMSDIYERVTLSPRAVE